MKRLLSLILSLVMLITMVCSGTFAATVSAGADDGFNDGAFGGWGDEEEEEVARYGYDALTAHTQKSKMQFLYNQIKNGVDKCEPEISLDYGDQTVTEAEVAVALDAYIRDYAEHFWLGNEYALLSSGGSVVAIRPTYLFDVSDLVDAKSDFDAAVDAAMAGVQDGWSDEKKAVYLHDYLADLITYREDTHAHNAYGALANGVAVCEGYAEAYQVLLREAGILSFIATGTSINPGTGMPENHAWNYVQMDGVFYHVDVTWDDQGEELFHAYFGLTDEMIQEDHTIGAAGYDLPQCTSDVAFYFKGKSSLLTSYSVSTVAPLLKTEGEAHVYVTGDTDGFETWYLSQDTILAIAKANGVTGQIEVGYAKLGREYVLRFGHKHTYDNGCDTTCNSCGDVRTVSGHVYDNSLDPNCNECGAFRGIVTILGVEGAVCVGKGERLEIVVNVTGDGLTYEWYYKDKTAAKFTKTKTFSGNTYSVDEVTSARLGRQVYCVITDKYGNKKQTETVTLTLHTYDNDCDTNCNICDALRQVGDHKSDAPACKDGKCITCGKDMPAVKEHKSSAHACQDGVCITCNMPMPKTIQCVSNAPDCQDGVCIICGGAVVAVTNCKSNAVYACQDGKCIHCDKDMPAATGCVSDSAYACQDGHCTYCGEAMPAVTGCVSDAPYACQDGKCTYCGKDMPSEIACESDAQYVCQDGKCIHCSKVMPAETTCKGVYAYPCQNGHCEYCLTRMDPTADHKYDNDCDDDCNVCGQPREVSAHDYKHKKSDDTYHWNACDCGAVDNKIPHDYKYTKYNETEHWNECECGKEESGSRCGHGLGRHYDDNSHWLDCICGYAENTEPHDFTLMDKDATHHWDLCICGKTAAKTPHVYANDADTDCDICGMTREVKVAIVTQPQSVQVKNGETAVVTVEAVGPGLTYQWYVKNKGDKSFGKSSIKTNTYTVKMSSTSRDRYLYCVIKDKYGNSVQTKNVALRMAATVTKQPATYVYAKNNANAKVTFTAAGDGLTYQWYVKNPGATEYVKSSVKDAAYAAKMTAANSGRLVYCVITDKYGHTTETNKVTMRRQATIVTQPKTVKVKNGATAKTTVKAAGDGLTYTWYIKNKGAKSFSKSSIKAATYSVKMSTKVNGRQVYCVVKDKYGKSVKSSTVTLKKK